MARRSQCSLSGDNPLDPNYLPPHYREEYRLAIDALVEEDLEGYYQFLQKADVVDFLCTPEIQHIQSSIHVPQLSTHHPEQRFPEIGADGSSDTYWPLHSDLDAPGLDLGWPQLHHFIGPTEVTTLVNPPEPDMPSIKDQARRLIKNAQQVIAIAMDMFTDVDMFADILNAAMRNVAVYIILDEQNAHHFVDMVSNCRVNLQSFQFLRVRTVQGITYQCRSGKSFKGQMMDRFLLTDCRAVLSGNYSFMWSYEKLHRCMAHLFLGQLVSTFDEEFRILYAQSQPLIIENTLGPMEDLGHPHKRPHQSKRAPHYRDPKKLLDPGQPDEWARPPYDEGDWRMTPYKRQDQTRGPANIYGRYPSQQMRRDPPFDQGVSQPGMMENPAFKRHSYAEGVPGRYSSQFLQPQGMPDPETQGRHLHRGQPPYPGPGRESDYSSYDKFWNQDCLSTDQYPEPGLPPGMDSPDGFDPVLNYLSSSRPQDFDQGSENVPAPDLPFGSPHPRRQSLGQPYACQTSPTPSNTTEQKLYFQEPNPDRKDPAVKRGLRNWRISSYLSAYENPEDEGLPMTMPQTSDPFEEPLNPVQQAPAVDLLLPKIPNVREFKVPAIPRASQMPSYAITLAREQPKKVPDEPAAAAAADANTTPTPSDSSSTTEGEKIEEAEQREPRPSVLRREDSFRRKLNAAQPRSSRLRSSLIFSSLDQQNAPEDNKSDQQDEGSDKGETEKTKLPFLSHLLGQKRTKEPIKWSKFIKSATFDQSSEEAAKPGDGDKAEDKDDKDALKEEPEAQESSKQPDVEDQAVQPSKPSITPQLFVDMNDPEARLMFFKELAAKRRAAKAAEAEKSKEKPPEQKPPTDPKDDPAVKKEEPDPKESAEKTVSTSEGLSEKGGSAEKRPTLDSAPKGPTEGLAEKPAPAESAGTTAPPEALRPVRSSSDASEQATNSDSCVSDASKSIKAEQAKVSADSGTAELVSAAGPLPDDDAPPSESLEEQNVSSGAVKEGALCHPPTPADSTPVNVSALTQGTDESESPRADSTSKECHPVTPRLGEEESSSAMESNPPKSDICPPPLQPEHDAVSGASSSSTAAQSSSSDHTTATHSSPKETASSNKTAKKPSLSPAYSLFLSDVAAAKTQSAEGTSQKSESLSKQSQDAEKAASESEKTIPKADKDISEPDKADSDSGKDISESEKLVSGSEKVVSSSSKDILETEKAKDSSQNIVPETEGVFESDKVVYHPGEDVSKSEIHSFQDSEVCGSSEDIKAHSMSPGISLPVRDSGSPLVESSASKADSKDTSTPAPTPATPQAEPSETNSSVKTDIAPSETTASSQEVSKQTTPPSDLNASASDTPISTETVSSSPPPPPSESDSSPEAKTAEIDAPAVQSSSDTKAPANETATNSNKESQHAATKCVSSPTEPTSKVPSDVIPPCKTPEAVTSESHTSDSSVPTDNNKTEPKLLDTDEQKSSDTKSTSKVIEESAQESVSEKTNDQVKQSNSSEAAEVTAKQPKSNQSRYHSSTANVLSSSNLRDDTKLLLEQISANSQTRSETAKEAPVTDDEKEDEADKNAKRELERGIRTLNKGPAKPAPEREKLLERIQCMRKERKVYSRFEV